MDYEQAAKELNEIYFEYFKQRPFIVGMPLDEFYSLCIKLIREMKYVNSSLES